MHLYQYPATSSPLYRNIIFLNRQCFDSTWKRTIVTSSRKILAQWTITDELLQYQVALFL
jgi:hypothetical protein